MNWSNRLRAHLRESARTWAENQSLRPYQSLGKEPTILFKPEPDGRRHGNFHRLSWRAIRANPAWAKRLEKRHANLAALPPKERGSAKELDSSNSSDALLMNCFCFPTAVRALLSGLDVRAEPTPPEFGYSRVALSNGNLDDTEVDMRIGNLFVEAKLTEPDFTTRSREHVRRYRDLSEVFDVDALPGDKSSFSGYQLIRNVLAAAQHEAGFVVLLDQRRPDLMQAWWSVHSAIRDVELRRRCGFRTWQQVAVVAPKGLRHFLQEKYGL